MNSAALIFSLISCVKPSNYDELHSNILNPLNRLFFISDVYFKCLCLNALTKLLHNQSLQNGRSLDSSQGPPGHEFQEIVFNLVNFVDRVAVVGLRAEDDHYLLQHATLDFLHTACQIYLKYRPALVYLPMQLIYRLMLSDSPATLARVCGIICM